MLCSRVGQGPLSSLGLIGGSTLHMLADLANTQIGSAIPRVFAATLVQRSSCGFVARPNFLWIELPGGRIRSAPRRPLTLGAMPKPLMEMALDG